MESAKTPSRAQRLLAQLGSLYGVALVMGIAATFFFGWLADEVLEAEFADFNRNVLLAIHHYSTPRLDTFALAITWLGSGFGVAILTFIFEAWLLRRKEAIDGWILLVTVVGGWILSASLKLVFQQPRPQVFPHLEPASFYSFPSGHSLISFTYWGFLAIWLILRNPRDLRRWGVGALCVAIASLVALSRLYIGVHWPTDVVAGFAVAVIWLSCCFAGRHWFIRRLRNT